MHFEPRYLSGKIKRKNIKLFPDLLYSLEYTSLLTYYNYNWVNLKDLYETLYEIVSKDTYTE